MNSRKHNKISSIVALFSWVQSFCMRIFQLSSTTSNTAQNGTGASESADEDLPSVMTCANYLKLPPYSTKVHMKFDSFIIIFRDSNFLVVLTLSSLCAFWNRKSCTRNLCMQSTKGKDLLICHEILDSLNQFTLLYINIKPQSRVSFARLPSDDSFDVESSFLVGKRKKEKL